MSDLYQEEVGVDIISSINSDHSAIVLHFNSTEEQRHGPSYWKSNTSLLDDPDFCKLITESVAVWCEESIEVNDENSLGFNQISNKASVD